MNVTVYPPYGVERPASLNDWLRPHPQSSTHRSSGHHDLLTLAKLG
ncbi:MAG: hypothetical protein ACFB4I_02655 [Cyanophyceae cyanobacterium]